MRGSLKAYKSVAVDSQKDISSPYRVVQMLLAGALERLARAKMAIEQQNVSQRGELIGSTIAIVQQLQASLDMDAGGEISVNLDNLYDFMVRELMLANSENNGERLEGVSRLLRNIKESWDAIPAAQQQVPA
ncbi:flagellar export chaperone FliS [Oceanisphaera psychrotolerans]|uniref:Flagellar secretion chaperone FliS n=1 Tax=Oceanisphaera psychrotolerans TaxID=1414654 RepID=A0A1J4QEY5_9GAMM|nr:flagellar export chaperone FliS [Oceanisphaera psychrotolerans]OIN07718.1 flagellar export chaperone FliS [Oceanisphaera psychrotolerans]